MHQICFPNQVPAVSTVSVPAKDLLFFYAGRLSHPVRKRLMKLRFPERNVVMQDTSTYNHFQADETNQRATKTRYWQLVHRSKFGLCPRGAGTSSVRLFELMEAGITPVIIADDWVPPTGPQWEEFALFVPETQISSLYEIIRQHENEWIERGRKARQAYETWFAPQVYWRFLMQSIQVIQKHQRVPETIYAQMLPWVTLTERTRQARIRSIIWIKGMARKAFKKQNSRGDTEFL
ncbi:MAG TPA: exostosin family protein [Candidatus Angelobacter sp.]|jgi:hypothetical protein